MTYIVCRMSEGRAQAHIFNLCNIQRPFAELIMAVLPMLTNNTSLAVQALP